MGTDYLSMPNFNGRLTKPPLGDMVWMGNISLAICTMLNRLKGGVLEY